MGVTRKDTAIGAYFRSPPRMPEACAARWLAVSQTLWRHFQVQFPGLAGAGPVDRLKRTDNISKNQRILA
jgi:hypothetical protein